MVGVEIKGIEELNINVGRVGNALEKAIPRALKLSGLVVEGKAKLLAPVDTGRLRNSIKSVMQSKTVVRVGTNVFYAKFMEFGTVFISPRPFLRPALRLSKNKIKQIFRSVLKTQIDSAVKR